MGLFSIGRQKFWLEKFLGSVRKINCLQKTTFTVYKISPKVSILTVEKHPENPKFLTIEYNLPILGSI